MVSAPILGVFFRQSLLIGGVARTQLASSSFLRIGLCQPYSHYGVIRGRRSLSTASSGPGGATEGSPESNSTSEASQDSPRLEDLRSHLIAFFKEYPEFDYDPTRPYMEQFYQMVKRLEWGLTGPRYKKAHTDLRKAMINQFNDIYGTDSEDYNVWSNLFSSLDIEDAPKDIKHCKKFARTKYVNVCNMVDAPVTRVKPRLFATEEELSEYTFGTQYIFPQDGEHMTVLARSFIRNLTNPSRKRNSLRRASRTEQLCA